MKTIHFVGAGSGADDVSEPGAAVRRGREGRVHSGRKVCGFCCFR